MKYSYECCVCITLSWQHYYIGHVTSIVFHCFQDRPYHLAPLTSLWHHDFSPDMHSATHRHPFEKFICPLYNELVFYGVGLRFVLIEQTKHLDAEFKYLIIFSIWVKSTLLNWNKNNSSSNQNTISMREKYSLRGYHWIYSHSTLGVSK